MMMDDKKKKKTATNDRESNPAQSGNRRFGKNRYYFPASNPYEVYGCRNQERFDDFDEIGHDYFESDTDPNGSYTGFTSSVTDEKPVQDADDL